MTCCITCFLDFSFKLSTNFIKVMFTMCCHQSTCLLVYAYFGIIRVVDEPFIYLVITLISFCRIRIFFRLINHSVYSLAVVAVLLVGKRVIECA